MERFRKVLLIDDDPISTFLHAKLIGRVGLAVETVTAANGEEACRMLAKECAGGSCPDLIIVDTHMRQMDGFGFLEEYGCLGIASPARIVLLSLTGARRDKERAERFDGVMLLPKPLTATALEIIREGAFGSFP